MICFRSHIWCAISCRGKPQTMTSLSSIWSCTLIIVGFKLDADNERLKERYLLWPNTTCEFWGYRLFQVSKKNFNNKLTLWKIRCRILIYFWLSCFVTLSSVWKNVGVTNSSLSSSEYKIRWDKFKTYVRRPVARRWHDYIYIYIYIYLWFKPHSSRAYIIVDMWACSKWWSDA